MNGNDGYLIDSARSATRSPRLSDGWPSSTAPSEGALPNRHASLTAVPDALIINICCPTDS
jgi:hypothetical protein